jgi:glycosyltransferase involved in cell wall biosynthesis
MRSGVTLTASTSDSIAAPRRPVRVGCCADFGGVGWQWIARDLGLPHVDWTFFSTQARGTLEKVIKRPALRRYRACRQLAAGARGGRFDLIVTHSPLVSFWTELFCAHRRKCPHVAFAFNFTELPRGPRLVLMKRAFGTLDRLIVFSNFEKTLYSNHFGIPETRFEMIPWRVHDPRERIGTIEQETAAVCAVGSQGRDYATLFDAMRRLPHIPLILVASSQNLKGLHPPPNVEVRQDVSLAEAEDVIRRSRFVIVPLLNSRTACGHVTLVFAMFNERAVVVTDSAGIADYVFPGRNGVLVRPGDPAALAQAVEDLWNSPDKARRLGEAGREFALSQCLESQTVAYVRQLAEQVQHTGRV